MTLKRIFVVVPVLLLSLGVASAATRPTLNVATNAHLHRQILVDSAGKTLYMFTFDPRNSSICTARSPVTGCSTVWPPFVVKGKPVAARGLDRAKVGTLKRSDGSLQVTYNGHALYRFAGYPPARGDKSPGDANGQGFEEAWYVLGPSGRPIKNG
jgi:predicted lipoprotein with Yx(FWY)xxD motif